MDGILKELLRLEDAKHHALIDLDPLAYEQSVKEQVRLIDDPQLAIDARSDAATLAALARLAGINANLYYSLLTTAPWLAASVPGYTGFGHLAETHVEGSFQVEG